MAMEWFRWYRDTCQDGKFRITARYARVPLVSVIATWAVILEDASNPEHRGVCLKSHSHLDALLDLDTGTTQKIIDAMQGVDLIAIKAGEIEVSNWKKRQFESDITDPTAAERMRRFRRRHASKTNGNDTDTVNNATVTENIRPEDRRQKTEQKTESESKQAARTKEMEIEKKSVLTKEWIDVCAKIMAKFEELTAGGYYPDAQAFAFRCQKEGFEPSVVWEIIENGMKNKPDIRSLGYFWNKICEAHGASNDSKPAVRKGSPKLLLTPAATAEEWTKRINLFKLHGVWDDLWGPRPGFTGCLAPAAIQEYHGYTPRRANGDRIDTGAAA